MIINAIKDYYKEFYMAKNKPQIVDVPRANYIAVRGKGNPNEEGGAYQKAISVLYAVAYTLKRSYKTDYRIKGFFEYYTDSFGMGYGLCTGRQRYHFVYYSGNHYSEKTAVN